MQIHGLINNQQMEIIIITYKAHKSFKMYKMYKTCKTCKTYKMIKIKMFNKNNNHFMIK